MLAERGLALEPRHVVMTDALHAAVPLQAGDVSLAEFDRLGSVDQGRAEVEESTPMSRCIGDTTSALRGQPGLAPHDLVAICWPHGHQLPLDRLPVGQR